jgi:hypothetical protein
MPMTINPLAICQGPADLYVAAYGTTEPTDANATVVAGPPGGAWVGVGGTEIGVTMEVDVTYDDLKVNQLIDPVGARPTARIITFKTQLKEATLANLTLATNSLTSVAVSGAYTTSDPTMTTSATQPSYTALILDGWAPMLASGQAARRRIILRKAVCKPKIMLDYELGKPVLYDVTFQGYYVSPSIPIYHIVDQTA